MRANGFCPKCGAIINNGVCTSCGYGGGISETGGRFSGSAGSVGAYSAQEIQPRQSGSKVWILIVVIILLCILVPLFLFVAFFSQVKDIIGSIGEVTPEPGWEDDYSYDEYIPSPADEYYEEIVSTTVRGLSYDIAWNSTSLYPDDEDVLAGFYYYYPVIIGSDAAFVDEINAEITAHALSYEAVELTGDNYGYVDAYVTYMSENKMSVVFCYYSEENGVENYRISALNYDMTTGEQISIGEMMPQFEFVEEFRRTCEIQNGYNSGVQLETMSDDEIMEAIRNPQTGVAFYSPVGVDFGFNYEDGWMTVTLKFGEY